MRTLVAVLCFASFWANAKELQVVLEGSEPNQNAVCRVPHKHFGMLNMECIRGARPDGTKLYAVKEDGVIFRVYEQVGDEEPKLIWAAEWQDA